MPGVSAFTLSAGNRSERPLVGRDDSLPTPRSLLVFRLSALALLLSAVAVAAPVPAAIPDDKLTDPAKFLPTRKFAPRGGTVVGVLVADAVKVMARDGRGSQPDAIAFSRDGGSYNWLYVPVEADPQITNFTVKTGEKGDGSAVYPSLGMASPKTTKDWGLSAPFTLVEVTVNDGKGAPADEAFVATAVRVVEGTKAYPLKAADVVKAAEGEYAKHVEGLKKELDEAMARSRKDALKDEKPDGKVKTEELVHVTWLPADDHLAVTFLTKRTDGAWKKGPGGANLDDGLKDPPPPGGGAIPPPPDLSDVVWGTGFGVEFGRTYLYSKEGKLVKTVTLAAKGFTQVIPPPPAPGRPFPLPVKPGDGPPPPAAPKK